MHFKKLIDLTHSITPYSPSWEGSCGFQLETLVDYQECEGSTRFKVETFQINASIGTHIDAPSHCFPDGKTVDQLDIDKFIAPCFVIDIRHKSREFYSLSLRDIKTFEAKYGTISKGSFVLIYTGWDRFWNTPEKYRNNLCFPSVSIEVAELLLDRGIIALGIDTLSPDRPADGFPVHSLLLKNDKMIVENVTNLKQMPPTGGVALCFPIKTPSTEAPIRLIGAIL